jgi:hypothetical protein
LQRRERVVPRLCGAKRTSMIRYFMALEWPAERVYSDAQIQTGKLRAKSTEDSIAIQFTPEVNMERLRGQRRSTNVTVQFFTRPATIGIGRVLNISATGAFMETQLPLQPLSLLYLQPTGQLPPDGARGRIAATVVRCTENGVGLEWCEFGAETTSVFARLITGANDLADEHQLPLPAMPYAPPLQRSRAHELPGLCRVEFLE